MEYRKRLKFRCCDLDCGKEYELTLSFNSEDPSPRLRVQCPYCNTGGTIALEGHRRPVSSLIRGEDGPKEFP